MARCSVHTMHMQNEIANELKAKMVTPKVTKRRRGTERWREKKEFVVDVYVYAFSLQAIGTTKYYY